MTPRLPHRLRGIPSLLAQLTIHVLLHAAVTIGVAALTNVAVGVIAGLASVLLVGVAPSVWPSLKDRRRRPGRGL